MPTTVAGDNLMLNALIGTNPTTPITHVGLLTKQANKSLTGVASTDVITSSAHGYSDGDLVVLSGLSGGAGLATGFPYFVRDSTTNTFKLALVPAGTAVDFTSDLSAGTANRLAELSGGSPAYARKSIAFAAASGGQIDDSTNGAVFDVPAGAVIDYVGFHSASTAGTLLAIDDVTQETFAAQGTYTVTDAKLTVT